MKFVAQANGAGLVGRKLTAGVKPGTRPFHINRYLIRRIGNSCYSPLGGCLFTSQALHCTLPHVEEDGNLVTI